MRRAIPALIALAVVVVIVVHFATAASPYVVRAEFADAEGLASNFDVQDRGVVVGRVASVSLTRSDRALVTLDLNPAVVPIGAGATAQIDLSNLLGEKYVELGRGNLDQPLASNSLIPESRTSSAPELDQVLDSFTPNTRQATAIFLSEEGDALLGRGQDLAAALSDLPGSLSAGRQLVAGFAQDNQALGRLIDQSGQVLAAATPQRAALGRLISDARGALATLAGRQAALRGTIAAAPSTLSQLRTTLVALQDASGPLGAAADGLATASPSLVSALKAVPSFAAAATQPLRTATATAPALAKLGQDGAPLVSALDPTAARLASFTTALAPVSSLLDNHVDTILDVLQGWARAISSRDGVGHLYRVDVVVPDSTFTTLLGALGVQSPVPLSASRPRDHKPSVPAPVGRHTGRHHTSAAPAPVVATATVASTTTTTPAQHPGLHLTLPPLLSGVLNHTTTTPQTTTTPAANPIQSLLQYLVGR